MTGGTSQRNKSQNEKREVNCQCGQKHTFLFLMMILSLDLFAHRPSQGMHGQCVEMSEAKFKHVIICAKVQT